MRIKSQESVWDSLYIKDENKWKLESSLPIIFKGKKVLEIGAGNGKTLKSILSQKPKEVTAIDISSEAINIIKSKFNNKILTALQASVTSMPFKNNEFDIIICFFTLNNLMEKERNKAVSEIHRVMKSQGIIIFSDFAEGDYRFNGKDIETSTIRKDNGLIFHVFTRKEVEYLFHKFIIKHLRIISSAPIRNNPKLIRKRIYLLAKKS